MFSVGEALFDDEMLDEYARRIKAVQVRLCGLGKRARIGGRIALIGHRTYLGPGKSDERSVLNVFGRQQVTVSGAVTDTGGMRRESGRFPPFERCGAIRPGC